MELMFDLVSVRQLHGEIEKKKNRNTANVNCRKYETEVRKTV